MGYNRVGGRRMGMGGFAGARLARAGIPVVAVVALAAGGGVGAAAQTRVATPSVQLVEEKAPKGRACGE